MSDKDTTDAMEAAAAVAKAELKNCKTADDVKEWFKRHYAKAGHKRLGRILVGDK